MQDSLIRVYKNAYTDEFCDKVIDAWESITKTDDETKNHDWSQVGYRRDKAIFMDEWSEDILKDEVDLRTETTKGVFNGLIPKVNDYLKDVGVFEEVRCVPHNVITPVEAVITSSIQNRAAQMGIISNAY